jgi:hypothetical protein
VVDVVSVGGGTVVEVVSVLVVVSIVVVLSAEVVVSVVDVVSPVDEVSVTEVVSLLEGVSACAAAVMRARRQTTSSTATRAAGTKTRRRISRSLSAMSPSLLRAIS